MSLSEEKLDQLIAVERARDEAPLNEWRTIAARAREEGLVAGQHRGWSSSQSWMQAAAAVILLVGGIAIGRTTVGLPNASGPAETQPTTALGQAAPAANTSSTVTSTATFASVDDASAALDRALTEYQRATAYLAANSSTGATTGDSSRIYSARLAALDQVGNAMESALQTAPHDPVINQYYLATMGARVATQQMVARPVGLALKGF
ncbi:MAG: hypothetical protein ABR585_10130 [Gemmatimonadaceae bacterium]